MKRYNSAWGWFAYVVILFAALICFGNVAVLGYSLTGLIIGILAFIAILIPLFTIYYQITDTELIVHCCFLTQKCPISKIKEIKSTKTWLSGPAISLSKRIAITFVDRSVMKSSAPLILSPSKQEEFINALLSVNHDIKVSLNAEAD